VLRSQNFRRRGFNRAAAEVGLEGLVPHELRHAAASLAIASGASVKGVQMMLGHASASMTLDRYGHLFGMSWTPWPNGWTRRGFLRTHCEMAA